MYVTHLYIINPLLIALKVKCYKSYQCVWYNPVAIAYH